jgi:hypothetical protein
MQNHGKLIDTLLRRVKEHQCVDPCCSVAIV